MGWPQVTKNKRFRCPCYEAKGKLFAFLVTDRVVLTQLLEGDREALRAKHRATAFGSEGRKIQKWVQVPAGGRDHGPLLPYVMRSYEGTLQGGPARGKGR